MDTSHHFQIPGMGNVTSETSCQCAELHSPCDWFAKYLSWVWALNVYLEHTQGIMSLNVNESAVCVDLWRAGGGGGFVMGATSAGAKKKTVGPGAARNAQAERQVALPLRADSPRDTSSAWKPLFVNWRDARCAGNLDKEASLLRTLPSLSCTCPTLATPLTLVRYTNAWVATRRRRAAILREAATERQAAQLCERPCLPCNDMVTDPKQPYGHTIIVWTGAPP